MSSTVFNRWFFAALLGYQSCASAEFVDVSASNLPQAALADRSMDVEFADLDGDRDPDIIVAKEFARNLWLRNDGSFSFSLATNAMPNTNEDSEDVLAGDFDGDGDTDVIFVSEDTATNEYFVNNGSGAFSVSPNTLPANTASNAGLVHDLDGDGDLDLIIARNNARELIMLNDGAGAFTDVSNTWMPDGIVDITQDIELADVDGDGDLDLLAANEPNNGGRNRVYIRKGNSFVDESQARIPLRATREETREVAHGDVDGDLDIDIVYGNVDFANVDNAANRILINNGSGFFSDETATRLPDIRRATLDVDLADVDGDLDLDLLIANFSFGLQVQLNNGAGVFTEATAQILGASASNRNTIDVEFITAAGARWIYEAGFNAVDRLLRENTDALFADGFGS